MPQLFQVLKCFKCSVFQVHQTKKTNKWECKLCSEKQSIKRHYGLGTGKECRLHVQKLNSIRGEIVETNKIANLSESSDEEVPEKDETIAPDNKQANLESKWSEYVDKTEDVIVPEPESMYVGNAEVVLEVPAKRRKFVKPKATKIASVSAYFIKTENSDKVSIPYCETQMSNVQKNIPVTDIVKNECEQLHKVTSNKIEFKAPIKTAPHKIDINSKWAQFVDETEEVNDNCEDTTTSSFSNDENVPNDDVPKNIFSLCDENDLDYVLDF